ncbi:MAG: hypothetical protein OEL78_01620 [Hyphomicrobiales bacterium]|nr:hypothetical protein [Hyphomicrobiales bacterium]
MIIFGLWAPDRATWEASWRTAGILDDENQLLPPYSSCVDHTADTWHGLIEKKPAVYDENGEEIHPSILVPGWHCNVRVWGAVEAQMIAGRPRVGEDGQLLSLFERTHAVAVFGLTPRPADTKTGFPAGYRSVEGIVYADAAVFSSPSNVYV